MAEYKVPQDVEADDKLIGPFSFRQFVYLIIVALAGAAAWGLGQLFIPLAIIPLPVILLFGALALPLRKDQPMEIYLAAMIAFFLKPRRRLWDPDGIESLIEITVPKVVEAQLTKDITQADADQRFGYLANLVDSQGWAVRGQGMQNGPINSDIYLEAQGANDLLDGSNPISQSFSNMMIDSDDRRRQEMIDRMHQQAAAAAQPVTPPTPSTFTTPDPPTPIYNPYPTEIQQAVIQPISADPFATQPTLPVTPVIPDVPIPQTTSDNPVSAGIMNLANNTDLSIETIAHEANRIQQQQDNMQEEVVISLR
ncbi:MAG: PrgI family protein [Candidatus Saccharimonadales bacterium]